jgi:hypothetical protein
MPTKNEFYRAVERVKDAAIEALKTIPEDLSPQSREGKIWNNLLSRLPNQLDDIRQQFSDPHHVTGDHRSRVSLD